MRLFEQLKSFLMRNLSYRTGLEHYENKQWKEALKSFELAVSKNPQHAQSNFKLGLCHMKLNEFDDARYYIEKALKLAPENKQWHTQLEQCKRHLDNNTQQGSDNLSNISSKGHNTKIKRICQGNSNISINTTINKKLLLVPSAYSGKALADVLPFVDHYRDKMDIFIILKDAEADIIEYESYTIVRNGTSYADFLKFTADYVIDAGSLNYGYRITDTNRWISVWHGIPYKKMFVDLDIKHLATAIRYSIAYDTMISMSDFYTDTFLKGSMRYDNEILQLGSAKVDKLFESSNNAARVDSVYNRLQIPRHRKIILYAPEYRKAGGITLPFSYKTLLESIGSNYFLLIKLDERNYLEHNLDSDNVKVVRELTNADASLVSSILISDYHSLIASFKAFNKQVVLYQYDYELFLRANPHRQDDLEAIGSYENVVTRDSKLYALDWDKIVKKAKRESLKENVVLVDLKQQLGIPKDKKVILYAPTFRVSGEIRLPFDPDKITSNLNNEYVILVKLHYLNSLSEKYDNIIDCTSYGELVDLMKISDILISDYSSLVLDYALLNKPIVLFQYDHYQYFKERGVYFDFEKYLPENQIVDRSVDLYSLDWNNLQGDNKKLIDTFYPLEDGRSTKRIVDALDLNYQFRKTKDIIFLVNELNQIGGVHSFLKNMARFYKEKYNSRIYVIAIKEFAQTNTEYHLLDTPYIDFKISSQYLNGACANILQNTDGMVISLQFSAHLHFQKHLGNAKTILMFHGDVKDLVSGNLYGPHLGWLNNRVLYNYEKLLLLTQGSVELLSGYVNDEVKDKLDFVHNSISLDFKPIPLTGSKNTAVISRLDADKNIMALIDLGKYIRDAKKDIVVNIYGDGALKSQLEADIKGHNLDTILKLKGYESDKEKIFTLNGSLLLLSKSEGFPLVILEAYAYARPVIAFDTFTSAKTIVKDEKTGFLIPYGNFQEIVNAIDKCSSINTEDIKEQFDKFSNSSVFNKWNTIFNELDSKVNHLDN